MNTKSSRDKRIFEIMSIIVALGMTTLFYKMGQHRMVALNFFFLVVLINGYYLGRAAAGVMALFCALSVTIAATVSSTGFAAYNFPVMVGLALTVWAGVLGLTAIITGTLCDERAKTVNELHKAYVGVVDVLSKYLQSANPQAKARSTRVAELSQLVAQEMGLPRKQIDDIRVAALLHDLGSFEITTQLINKAVDTLETKPGDTGKSTFLGTDLVHSLSSVLEGALPLLVSQDHGAQEYLSTDEVRTDQVPLGTRIISAVRTYDTLTTGDTGQPPAKALSRLRRERAAGDDHVIRAIERAVGTRTETAVLTPV